MVKKYVFAAFFAVLCMHLQPLSVHAETVVRTGSNIGVDAEQVVPGDYYVSVGPFGNTTMSGTVAGDMYALGGVVNINGTIKNDVFIVGGSAQMHATVTDDVRIVAGEVTVADHVGGDLFVLGGVLKVLSTATIDGDVIFYGGTADIAGTVKGSVLGTSEALRVDAVVGKNIDVETVQSMTLGENATVAGYVTYMSGEVLTRAQNSSIQGELQHIKPALLASDGKGITLMSALPLLISLFTTLALYLLFRRHLETIVLRAQKFTLKTALIGVSVILFLPSLAVLMLLTGLGFFIGLMALTLFAFGLLLAYTISGVVLGSYLAKWFTNHPKVTLLWVVIGTLTLQLALFVPIFGIVLALCFTTIALGTLIMGAYNFLV